MKSVRFLLITPAQPKYRVPVFRELAAREDVELEVVYGKNYVVANTLADGYRAHETPERRLQIGNKTMLMWHSAQLTKASGREADVIGFSWNVRYLSLVPALLLARARRIPTVLWGHGFSKQESRFRKKLRTRIGGMATAVILYNHSTATKLIDEGMKPNRVFVALNAIDQTPIQEARSQWLNDPGRVGAFRQAQGLAGRPVVLFVSRLDPANRVELLLGAVAKLRNVIPGITAVIVGSGTAEADLFKLASELNLDDGVRFLGPIYDELELAGWMMSADVYCYPANIGLSLLHAFGYGLPVVTGDNVASHNPEIEAFEHEINGLFFRHGDVCSLARTLERLIRDRTLAELLGEGGRRTVLERFTLPVMVDGLEAAIKFAASCGKRQRGITQ